MSPKWTKTNRRVGLTHFFFFFLVVDRVGSGSVRVNFQCFGLGFDLSKRIRVDPVFQKKNLKIFSNDKKTHYIFLYLNIYEYICVHYRRKDKTDITGRLVDYFCLIALKYDIIFFAFEFEYFEIRSKCTGSGVKFDIYYYYY